MEHETTCGRATWPALAGLLLLLLLVGCGGSSGGGTGPSPVPTPAPPPAAAVTALGAGALVLHPSAHPAFTVGLEAPLRIRETAGGSADWNFARFSLFRGGIEIERGELGADQIRAGGFARIAANSDVSVALLFRFNADDFDRIDLTLGFGDIRDGRQFTVLVPFASFSGLNISLTPLSVPDAVVRRP